MKCCNITKTIFKFLLKLNSNPLNNNNLKAVEKSQVIYIQCEIFIKKETVNNLKMCVQTIISNKFAQFRDYYKRLQLTTYL